MVIKKEAQAFYEAKVDIRDLATIASYFVKAGRPIGSYNMLGAEITRDFAEILIKNSLGEEFRAVEDAEAFLETTRLKQTRRVSRYRQKIIKKITQQSIENSVKGADRPISPGLQKAIDIDAADHADKEKRKKEGKDEPEKNDDLYDFDFDFEKED